MDDCTGILGGETNSTVCALDAASVATAGVGEIAARAAATASRAAESAAATGVKEYTAAVKAEEAAGLESNTRQLNLSKAGLGTWALDVNYRRQLNGWIGGTDAESSGVRC